MKYLKYTLEILMLFDILCRYLVKDICHIIVDYYIDDQCELTILGTTVGDKIIYHDSIYPSLSEKYSGLKFLQPISYDLNIENIVNYLNNRYSFIFPGNIIKLKMHIYDTITIRYCCVSIDMNLVPILLPRFKSKLENHLCCIKTDYVFNNNLTLSTESKILSSFTLNDRMSVKITNKNKLFGFIKNLTRENISNLLYCGLDTPSIVFDNVKKEHVYDKYKKIYIFIYTCDSAHHENISYSNDDIVILDKRQYKYRYYNYQNGINQHESVNSGAIAAKGCDNILQGCRDTGRHTSACVNIFILIEKDDRYNSIIEFCPQKFEGIEYHYFDKLYDIALPCI